MLDIVVVLVVVVRLQTIVVEWVVEVMLIVVLMMIDSLEDDHSESVLVWMEWWVFLVCDDELVCLGEVDHHSIKLRVVVMNEDQPTFSTRTSGE